jgi:predicted chitinase
MPSNKDIVIKALQDSGITNEYSIAAALAIIDKESGFKPQNERSYSGTDNSDIRRIFEKTKKLSDAQLTALKKDRTKFFDYVYGGRYGNSSTEGAKYAGRGFNQLTFKGNYKLYADILKLPLVENPDMVNDPQVAAKVAAEYFKRTFKKDSDIVKKRYGASNINDFKDSKTAVNAFYNSNAGFKKDTSNITTAGKTKALKKVSSFLDNIPDVAKKGAMITLPLLFIGALAFYYLKK